MIIEKLIFRSGLLLLSALFLATSPVPISAQDDSTGDLEPEMILATDDPVLSLPGLDDNIELNTRVYVELNGGGELVGLLAKKTPDAWFLDIGPEIVRLTRTQIRRLSSLADAQERLMSNPDLLQSIFSEGEEASLSGLPAMSRSGSAEEIQSQADIIDHAKRSVVLISNPGGAGSGFILDQQGRIVTNHHVINGEKYHNVTVFERNDQDQWVKHIFRDVEVEAYSWLYDIAVLQLDLDKVEEEGVSIQTLPVSAPDQLSVGDQVFAIGNPGGLGRMLEHTVSEGIVSSLTRNVNDVLYIQTTAAVNPGNSGGPIVNSRGEVVGLVTLKSSFQEGIGFALPSSLIRHFLDHSEAFAYGDQAPNKGIRYLTPP